MNKKTIWPILAAGVLAIAMICFGFCIPSHSPIKTNSPSELVDQNNKPVDFSAFKGKVVFVNNWATWCGPCVAEMPTISELRKTIPDENLVFVMVSFDESKEKALKFMQKKGYGFEVYFPGDKYPFFTNSIPATYLIDKNGKAIGPHVGMADYSDQKFVEQVKALLK